jgi:hypothetical protein
MCAAQCHPLYRARLCKRLRSPGIDSASNVADVATLRKATYRKRHNDAMLQNVAAHNVRVPKRKVFKT